MDTDAEIERIKSEIELEQKNKQTLGEDKDKDSIRTMIKMFQK